MVKLLLLPAFILAVLTFALAVRTGLGRVKAVRSGETSPASVLLDNKKWPDAIRQITNNYENQFELPVLYYFALCLVLIMGLVDPVFVGLSWLFVLSRLVHSYIHTGSNDLRQRFYAFAAGLLVLMILWAWLALRLFVSA